MENSKVAIGVAIALGAAALGYYLLQPVPVEEVKKPPPKPVHSPQKPVHIERPRAKVEEIKEERPPHTLSLDEYIVCIRSLNQILITNLTNLKREFIQTRRQQAENQDNYEKAVRKYKISEKKIWDSACEEMLAKEKILRTSYDVAHEQFLNRHEVASEKESLKLALTIGKAPEDIDLEKLQEIMNFEIKLLSEAQNVEDEVKNLETISRIEDKIYEEFNLEIDEVRALSHKFKDQVKGLQRQILRNYQKFKL